MSKVRHVYAADDEYIAVHRRKKSISYTPSAGSSYYKPVEKTVNQASIITRLIAGIILAVSGWSICGWFSVIWLWLMSISLFYSAKPNSNHIGAAFSAAIFLIIPGLFCNLDGALIVSLIVSPIVSLAAHVFDDE